MDLLPPPTLRKRGTLTETCASGGRWLICMGLQIPEACWGLSEARYLPCPLLSPRAAKPPDSPVARVELMDNLELDLDHRHYSQLGHRSIGFSTKGSDPRFQQLTISGPW